MSMFISFIIMVTWWCHLHCASASPVIDFTLSCNMTSMSATFTAQVPNTTTYITDRILTYTLRDTACTGTTNATVLVGTATQTFELDMTVDYNTNLCGVMINSTDTHIIIENEVILQVSDMLGRRKRDFFYRYNLICNTTRNYTIESFNSSYYHVNISGSVVPTQKPVTPAPVEVPDNLLPEPFCVYDDNTFTTCKSFPLSVPINEDLHMIVSPPNPDLSSVYKVAVKKCQAQDDLVNPTVVDVFLDDNCPLDPTFEFITSQSTNSKVAFKFRPFSFDSSLNIADGMFIKCEGTLCLSTDNSTDCTNDCTSSSRKRRDVIENNDGSSKGFTLVSGKIRLDTDMTCSDVKCSANAKCHNLKPARCVCDKGYVFSRVENKCVNKRLVSVKNIHLDQKWNDKLIDTTSLEFHNLVSMYEEILYKSFMAAKTTHILEGVRIIKATKGSVILEVVLIYSSTSTYLEAYQYFVRSINVKSRVATTVRNHLKLLPDRTPEVKMIQETDIKTILIVIISVILLLLMLILFVIVLKKKKRNINEGKKVITFVDQGVPFERF